MVKEESLQGAPGIRINGQTIPILNNQIQYHTMPLYQDSHLDLLLFEPSWSYLTPHRSPGITILQVICSMTVLYPLMTGIAVF